MPALSHLTSCTPTKSDLYLANSLAAAVSEPALYRLLTFHVPILMSLFCCLGRTKVSVQVRGLLYECFVTGYFLRWGVINTLLNTQVGGPPFVGCPRLLIHYICSDPPYWRLFSICNLRTCHAVVTEQPELKEVLLHWFTEPHFLLHLSLFAV